MCELTRIAWDGGGCDPGGGAWHAVIADAGGHIKGQRRDAPNAVVAVSVITAPASPPVVVAKNIVIFFAKVIVLADVV